MTHFECVSADLGSQYVMRTRHIFIYGMSGCTTFFHIIS